MWCFNLNCIFILTYLICCIELSWARNPPNISTNPNDVHFYLYPKTSDPDFKQEIVYNDTSSLISSSYQSENKTVFITHGFRSNYTSEMPQSVKNAYLNSSLNYNYIVVDWGALSTPTPPQLTAALYFLAVNNVPTVATRVSDFISWLINQNKISLSNIHLIGHSLGSHVSGLTGLYLQQKYNGSKIFRITGLDPAGPLYFPPIASRNLVKTDATFVDAVHTNMGQLGDITMDGQVDFYPNGGATQPGCALNDTGIPQMDPTFFGRCSHRFAYYLYVASFTKKLYACKCSPFLNLIILQVCLTTCPEKILFGVYCPTTAVGQYYLKTTNPT